MSTLNIKTLLSIVENKPSVYKTVAKDAICATKDSRYSGDNGIYEYLAEIVILSKLPKTFNQLQNDSSNRTYSLYEYDNACKQILSEFDEIKGYTNVKY